MASNHLPPAPSCFQEGETGGGKNTSSVGCRRIPIVWSKSPAHLRQSVGERVHHSFFDSILRRICSSRSGSDCFAGARNDDVGVTASRSRHCEGADVNLIEWQYLLRRPRQSFGVRLRYTFSICFLQRTFGFASDQIASLALAMTKLE